MYSVFRPSCYCSKTLKSYSTKTTDNIFTTVLDAEKIQAAKPRIPILKNKNSSKSIDRYDSHATSKNLTLSIKRIYPFTKLVRRVDLTKAMNMLKLVPNRSAKLLLNTINIARGNALARGFNIEDLQVDRIVLGRGEMYKRLNIHGKSAHGIRTISHTHLTVFIRPKKEVLEKCVFEKTFDEKEKRKGKFSMFKRKPASFRRLVEPKRTVEKSKPIILMIDDNAQNLKPEPAAVSNAEQNVILTEPEVKTTSVKKKSWWFF